MIEPERGLHPQKVPTEVRLVTPDASTDRHVSENDPARNVMTDFRLIKPFQIESNASLEATNSKMIACGVRLLFVNDPGGNLAGLITSTDILGEKPLLYVTQNGGARDDITAEDIMTPLAKLEGITLNQVLNARVADIVKALKDCRRHHMLVIDSSEGTKCVRGLFSITHVGRQLGTEITPSVRAEGFAQISKALG
jgi:CBS-domain-containing membrane protein